MLSGLYKIYNKTFSHPTVDDYYKRICTRLSNIIFRIVCQLQIRSKHHQLKTIGEDDLNSKEKYIVSLTSFPLRIDHVWLTIESILRQISKPDAIILWLYKGEFEGKDSLPKNLLKLEERGLQIRFCDENIKPHKKYYYTFQNYPEANIITVDDDIIYPPDLIKNFKRYQRKFPGTICCTISRKIKTDDSGTLPYQNWKLEPKSIEPSFQHLPIGAGGVLYSPHTLDPEVLNIQILKKLALIQDDLWLKIMSIKKGAKVVSISNEYPRFFIPMIIKNNKQLMKSNINGGQNDKAMEDILNYYGFSSSIFQDPKYQQDQVPYTKTSS